MSKKSRSRRAELIRSMEGLAVVKSPPAVPSSPSAVKPVRIMIGMLAGIAVAVTGLWLLH